MPKQISMEILEIKLTKLDTHPQVVTLLIKALTLDEHEDMPEVESEDPAIQKIAEEKQKIGWYLIQLGILSTKWKELHEEHKRWKGDTLFINSGSSWGKKTQAILWAYTFGAWDNRNKTLKGRDIVKQRSIAAKKITDKVQHIFQYPLKVGHADTILFQNRQNLMSKSTRYQKAWLRQVDTVAKKERAR